MIELTSPYIEIFAFCLGVFFMGVIALYWQY